MSTLKEIFTTEGCMPVITPRMLQDLERFTRSYEVRDDHPLAFNTPMLAVNRSYWFPKDTEAVFAIFGIDRQLFKRCISKCPGINKSFNVTSDEFNILIIWLVHLVRSTKSITKTDAYKACSNLILLILYKFFCGKVAQQFKYGARADVMQYTIDNLTAKSDIKNEDTDTWKKIIYRHCEMSLAVNSIYTSVFDTFAPDSAVAKAISDIHTRICRKIVLISEVYYENVKLGRSYGTSNIMGEDSETGKKVLGELKAGLDVAIGRMCTSVLNVNTFIDQNMVNITVRLLSAIRKDMVVDMLQLFSAMATQQNRDKEAELVTVDRQKQQTYVGYAVLIREIIQKTYRRAVLSGVDVTSLAALVMATRNMYSSSRVTDTDIVTIKTSVDKFMERTKYTRQGTLVSLRLALIIYLILMTFKRD